MWFSNYIYGSKVSEGRKLGSGYLHFKYRPWAFLSPRYWKSYTRTPWYSDTRVYPQEAAVKMADAQVYCVLLPGTDSKILWRFSNLNKGVVWKLRCLNLGMPETCQNLRKRHIGSLAFKYPAFLLQLELHQPKTISYGSLNVGKYRDYIMICLGLK